MKQFNDIELIQYQIITILLFYYINESKTNVIIYSYIEKTSNHYIPRI